MSTVFASITTPGPPGPPGRTTLWLTGTVPPVPAQGLDGDMYLNSTTGDVYGPKAGVWGGIVANIKGTTGNTGATGPAGYSPRYIVAAGPPAVSTGNDGDMYLDNVTFNLYGPKTAGAWGATIGTIKGPTGATGAQGPPGVAYTPRGAWSSATTYAQGDMVSDAGVAYISLQSANLNHVPLSSPSWWQAVASGGSQTPWNSDIDGNTFKLAKTGGISIGNVAAGSIPANTLVVSNPTRVATVATFICNDGVAANLQTPSIGLGPNVGQLFGLISAVQGFANSYADGHLMFSTRSGDALAERMRIWNDGTVTVGSGSSEVLRVATSRVGVLVAGTTPVTVFQVGTYSPGTGEATVKGMIQIQDASGSANLNSSAGYELKQSPSGAGFGWKISGVNTTDLGIGYRYNSATWVEAVRFVSGNGNMAVGHFSNITGRLTVSGAGQNTTAFNTAGTVTNVLELGDTGGGTGNGGVIVFSAGGQAWKFAAIKGYVTTGSNNTQGDICFSTRRVDTDATLTEAVRINAAGNFGIACNSGFPLGVARNGGGSQAVTAQFTDPNTSNSIGPLSLFVTLAHHFVVSPGAVLTGVNSIALAVGDGTDADSQRKVTVLANGSVGVGTNQPFSKLSFGSTSSDVNSRIAFFEGSTGLSFRGVGMAHPGSSFGVGVWAQPSFAPSDTNMQLFVQDGGNVSVGSPSPQGRFSITPSSNPSTPATATQLTVGETTNTAGYYLSVGYMMDSAWKGSVQAVAGGAAAPLIINGIGGFVGVNKLAPAYQVDIAGDCNITGTYRVNGTPISTGGSGYAGVTTSSSNLAGSSRVIGTPYQNTSGKPMFVTVATNSLPGNGVIVDSGAATSGGFNAGTKVGQITNGGNASAYGTCSFWVLPNLWYQLTVINAASLTHWTEWT